MREMEKNKRYSAFTLIELLIVVAIISILIAGVYPSYSNMTVKAQRTEGASILFEVQSHLERYYFHHQIYPEKLSVLRQYQKDKVDSANAHYIVSLDKTSQSCPSGSCYVLLAEHRSGRKQETLKLSSKGEKEGPW